MDTISWVIHDCEKCTVIRKATEDQAPVVWGVVVNVRMGRPVRSIASHCCKPAAKASIMC